MFGPTEPEAEHSCWWKEDSIYQISLLITHAPEVSSLETLLQASCESYQNAAKLPPSFFFFFLGGRMFRQSVEYVFVLGTILLRGHGIHAYEEICPLRQAWTRWIKYSSMYVLVAQLFTRISLSHASSQMVSCLNWRVFINSYIPQPIQVPC